MDVEARILELFKGHSGEFLSGEDLSRMMKMTRAAIWKHVEKLRDTGYDIEACPHLGYRLKGIPDKLLPDEITYGLKTSLIGKKVYSYASTGSTNTVAYKMAEDGAPEGVIVCAEFQTGGKGRLGRKWVSPHGGIYISCIIRPDIMPSEIQEFTLVSALSVLDSLKDVTGIDAKIKWPNDIIVNGKKIAGILTEMKAETDRIDFIILGIGININISEKDLPDTATSIKAVLERRIHRVDIVRAVIENLEKEYKMFCADGFEPAHKRIRQLSDTIGKDVKVTSHNVSFKGTAVDIDSEGALIVRLDDGSKKRILSGDVASLKA